jgi:hypothetical protein
MCGRVAEMRFLDVLAVLSKSSLILAETQKPFENKEKAKAGHPGFLR